MPKASEDFWPDEIPDPADPAPVVLLKEQAALLGQKMNGELEGVVRSSTDNGLLYFSLYLKADVLGDYLYKLLDIAYQSIGQVQDYPILARGSDDRFRVNITSDEQFREWLRKQLASDYVRSALGHLRRYVRERRSSVVR